MSSESAAAVVFASQIVNARVDRPDHLVSGTVCFETTGHTQALSQVRSVF